MFLSNDERDELRSTARGLLARESSSERVRAAVAEPAGFDRSLWDTMAELGWTTIHVPSDRGGAGCGYADLAVVLHELGRAITPSPFLASAVLASGALMLADDDGIAGELLPLLASGASLGSVAFAGTDGSYDCARLTTGWRSAGGSLLLNGASGFVLDADLAAVLVVARATTTAPSPRSQSMRPRPACTSSTRQRSMRRAACSRCPSTVSPWVPTACSAIRARAPRHSSGTCSPWRDRGGMRRDRRGRARWKARPTTQRSARSSANRSVRSRR